jgi:hypothetical protein
VRLAVFIVLAIHVVILVPLLVQGCKREEAPPPETNLPPAMEETNLPPAEAQTNLVLPSLTAPTNVAPVMSPVETAPAPAAAEYVVGKGDTFYSIARKSGVSIKAIIEANPGVVPTKLKVGQKLTIPAAAGAVSAGAAAVESFGGETTYVV